MERLFVWLTLLWDSLFLFTARDLINTLLPHQEWSLRLWSFWVMAMDPKTHFISVILICTAVFSGSHHHSWEIRLVILSINMQMLICYASPEPPPTAAPLVSSKWFGVSVGWEKERQIYRARNEDPGKPEEQKTFLVPDSPNNLMGPQKQNKQQQLFYWIGLWFD